MWLLLSVTAIAVVTADPANYNSEAPRFPKPSERQIKEAFTYFMIVPQIIPVAPKAIISKAFNQHYVNLGNKIPPCDTRVLPFTSYPNNPNLLYTFISIDPDNPQFFNTDGSQLLIELIVNIPGSNIGAGTPITPFLPTTPIPNTGHHRYIYLVYKQPARINVTLDLLISTSTNFQNFSIANFVQNYRLGNPVAGNFYRARQSLCNYVECCKELREY